MLTHICRDNLVVANRSTVLIVVRNTRNEFHSKEDVFWVKILSWYKIVGCGYSPPSVPSERSNGGFPLWLKLDHERTRKATTGQKKRERGPRLTHKKKKHNVLQNPAYRLGVNEYYNNTKWKDHSESTENEFHRGLFGEGEAKRDEQQHRDAKSVHAKQDGLAVIDLLLKMARLKSQKNSDYQE